MNGPREQRPESDTPIGALALHRNMRDQALRVPWRELASACEHMALWRSFSLWVRAIVDAEQGLPAWLVTEIEDRCPAFLRSRRTAELESLWLDLNEWVDHHFFAEAAHRSWIQALHYYCGRLPVAEHAWQCWTKADDEWRASRPSRYPTFTDWRATIEKVSEGVLPLDRAAETYVEWEAFSFWARSLVQAAREIPALVRSALEGKCPGFMEYVTALRPRPCSDPQWLWEQLLQWVDTHSFSEASREKWLDRLQATARRSLRSERVVDYWTKWSTDTGEHPVTGLPTFEQWLAAADAFVVR